MRKIMNFASCTKGSVALVFSLTLIPVLALGGMALDYSRASSAKTAAQNAADAAALGGTQMSDKSLAEMQAFARNIYDTNMTGVADTSSLTFTAVRKPEGVEVTASFQNKNYISSVVGGSTNAVHVKSLAGFATSSVGQYIDVYYLIDLTGSMNIPDGVAEINKLHKLYISPIAGVGTCSFACHTAFAHGLDFTAANGGKTGYQIARDNGIYLREDRIKDSVISSLNKFKLVSSAGNIRVSTQYIGVNKPSSVLTNNIDQVIKDVAKIESDSSISMINDELIKLKDIIGVSGNGTASSPKKIVIFVTDGIENTNFEGADPKPIDVSNCDNLKKNGLDVYILSLAYPSASVVEGDPPKMAHLEKLMPSIMSALKQCASPSLYYTADTGIDIQNKFNSVADHITTGAVSSKLRLFK
jgi:Flp pilus assembly protein TadG